MLASIQILIFFTYFYAASFPVEDPHIYDDYGQTPDNDMNTGLGMDEQEIKELMETVGSGTFKERINAAGVLKTNMAGSEKSAKKVLMNFTGARNQTMRSAIQKAKRVAGENDAQKILLNLFKMETHNYSLVKGANSAAKILSALIALDSLDTLKGYKTMIEFSYRHAAVFRHIIGKMLVNHELDALPALVYGRKSKSKNIQISCVKWIRDMGNPLFSEQVQIKNPRRLAQLLEAYVTVNDLDAINITLSMIKHPSPFVRQAARKSILAYGTNAKWQVFRLYENIFENKPPESSTIEQNLDKLYGYFDNLRLKNLNELFKTGKAAFETGDYGKMYEIYRRVLQKAPMFPQRSEMADHFFKYLKILKKNKNQKKYEKVLLLANAAQPSSEEKKNKIKALMLLNKALPFKEKGIIVPWMYEEILLLDPQNNDATKVLSSISQKKLHRYDYVMNSLIVGFLIFMASLIVYFRIKRQSV